MNEQAPIVQTTARFATLADLWNAARAQFGRRPGGALLIGIEDYKAFDGSGEKDLLAGRNDVLACWKACRRLGYTRIRVLTSPVLTEDDIVRAELELVPELHPGETADQVKARVQRWLANPAPAVPDVANKTLEETEAALTQWATAEDGAYLRPATAAEMKDGARWLAMTLIFDEKSKSLPGIMTYSGHGAQGADDLMLCPTDTGPRLENAVPFAELRGIFEEVGRDGGASPTDNLTIFLDCCFAGSSAPLGKGERATTLTPAAPGGKAPLAKTEIGNRVFCASGREEQSQQAMLAGYWHGAFTWAFTVALEQWKLKEEGAFKYSTMSYSELLFRARMLLQALSFNQHPMLVGELGNLPVFHQGAEDGDVTSADPTAWRAGVQLTPVGDYQMYKFQDASGNDCAWGRLFKTSYITYYRDGTSETWLSEKEYWKVISGGTPTKLVLASFDPNNIEARQDAYTIINRTVTWSSASDKPDLLGPNSAWGVTVSFPAGGTPSVTWYRNSASNLSLENDTYALSSNSSTSFSNKAST